MKKILTFKGFETLNERILIPSDEDKRLKEEVIPKIFDLLGYKSRWVTHQQLEDLIKNKTPLPTESFVPFKYKMATGEDSEVKIIVPEFMLPDKKGGFMAVDRKDLKDNIIRINGPYYKKNGVYFPFSEYPIYVKKNPDDWKKEIEEQSELPAEQRSFPFQRIKTLESFKQFEKDVKKSGGLENYYMSVLPMVKEINPYPDYADKIKKAMIPELPKIQKNIDKLYSEIENVNKINSEKEKDLLSTLKHELIHAKDPGLKQYKYSEKHLPRGEKYHEKYYETKPEGLAFGGEFIEEIKDRAQEFVKDGMTEEKVKTLNTVFNSMTTNLTELIDSPQGEMTKFLKYDSRNEVIKQKKEMYFSDSKELKHFNHALKNIKNEKNPEFKKFQKKLYQVLVEITRETNLLLSQKYPDIKGRIKISSSL